MKTRAIILAIMSPILFNNYLMALPPVSNEFSNMSGGVYLGKRLNEIIEAKKVQSIALIENRGKGSPITKDFRPQWSSDELIRSVFESEEKAKDWSLSATEQSYAQYVLVTKDGNLYLLEVVCDQLRGSSPVAILLRGRGFGCRINIKKTTAEQDGAGQPATAP